MNSPLCLTSSDFQPADEVSNRLAVVASHFRNALVKIEHRIPVPNAPCPILRVFTSWPADAKLERTQDFEESEGGEIDEDNVDVIDPDPHPLVTLHSDNFINNSDKLTKSWFNSDAEQAVVTFAKEQYDNEV